MASGNDGGSATDRGNASNALLPFERKALQEARSYAVQCKTDISNYQKDFNDKTGFGRWLDAKGFFNVSDKDEVCNFMENFKEIYGKIDQFSEKVQGGETNCYHELIDLYEEIETLERDAESEVESNKSRAVCQMLRNFLRDKYKLDHNVKKVECVILRQQTRSMEQAHQKAKEESARTNRKIDSLIEENRQAQERNRREKERMEKESEERTRRLLEESEDRIRETARVNEELRSEAERNRLESEERVKKAVEEADRKAESRMKKMAEKHDAAMKKIMKMLEDMKAP